MQRDAEAHAAEDKKKRELAEARNAAEQRVYQMEKTLEEGKDKLSDADKQAVKSAIDAVNAAKGGDDLAAINAAVENLTRAGQAMSEHLYAANGAGAGAGSAEPAGAGAAAGGGGAKDDVIDVEFDDKK